MRRRTLTNKDKEEIGLQCCNCQSTEDLEYHHVVPIIIFSIDIVLQLWHLHITVVV